MLLSANAEESSSDFDSKLKSAKLGSSDAVGQLLDDYRGSLLKLAETLVDSQLRPKAGASDLVQVTMIDAEKGINGFRGNTSTTFEAWLKQILANNVLQEFRKYRSTQKRETGREVSLEHCTPAAALDCGSDTPSVAMMRDESNTDLMQAVEQLSSDYQQVIRLRHFDGLEFGEIAQRLDRSEEATRKLWYRAFAKLSQVLKSVTHAE